MPQIVTSNVAYGHVSTAHFISRTRIFVDLTRPQLFKRWIELSTGKLQSSGLVLGKLIVLSTG